MVYKLPLFLIALLSVLTVEAKPKSKVPNAPAFKKPLCFLENKGQIKDFNNEPRKDIQFKLTGSGVSLFIGNGALHYQFKDVHYTMPNPDIRLCEMNVKLLNANPNAKVVTNSSIDYHENYLSESGDLVANAYQSVTYLNVYPNIDWHFYIKGDKVEYDFVVHKGGKVSDIQLEYDGATGIEITDKGALAASTALGKITEEKPYTYNAKTHEAIASNFKLNHNIVSFNTAPCNEEIVIDPFLGWCTYFGGGADEAITAIDVSPGGTYYFCGYTTSTGLGGPGGVFQGTFGGGSGYDAFVARINNTGTTVAWCTYWGGTGNDMANDLALSASANNTYVVGSSTSTTGGLANRPNTTNSGGTDIFLFNVNSTNGGRFWALYDGGTGEDVGTSVTTDAAGFVYIGATTRSTGMSSDGTTLRGGMDGFLAKVNGFSAAYSWATYVGGNRNDSLTDIHLDVNNFLLLTGVTTSDSFVSTTGVVHPAISGASDAFVMKYNNGGSKLWGTYFGGPNNEEGMSINAETTTPFSIYVTGGTTSTSGIASGLSYQSTYGGGGADAFLAKIDQNGTSTLWATYLGGSGSDIAYAMDVDGNANLVIAGTSNSTSGVATSQGYQTSNAGGNDAFYAKFNSFGQNIYASYFGGSGNEAAYTVLTDPTVGNRVLLAGATTSTSGLTTGGVWRTGYQGGGSDAYITCFTPDTLVRTNTPVVDTDLCVSGTFTVTFTANANFRGGNVYSVQLSDSSGSFIAPVTIGTLSSTALTGSIVCTIPAATIPGVHYKYRIAASAPAFVSPDDINYIHIFPSLAPMTLTANTPVCVGYALNLNTYASYSISTYSWRGPTGFTSTLRAPSRASMTMGDAGYYVVTATHRGCPNRSDSINVTVSNVIPRRPFLNADTPVCAGTPLRLYAWPDSSISGTYTYQWLNSSGVSVSSARNAVITGLTTPGLYPFYLSDTLNGCASPLNSILVQVVRADTPNIIISVTPNDTVCYGTMLNFVATTTRAGVSPTYQWYSSPTTPIVGATYSYLSIATLTGYPAVSCIVTPDATVSCPDKPRDTSNTLNMAIFENTPVVHIAVTPDSFVTNGGSVTFTGAVAGSYITGYQWYANGVAIPGATNTTYTRTNIRATATIKLVVTSSAPCANAGVSNQITVRIGSDVATVAPDFAGVNLFPNPTNGTITLSGELLNGINNKAISFTVTNLVGNTVFSDTINPQSTALQQSYDLSHLPQGFYFVNLNANGQHKSFKLLISK